jgi:hypothetical protein
MAMDAIDQYDRVLNECAAKYRAERRWQTAMFAAGMVWSIVAAFIGAYLALLVSR